MYVFSQYPCQVENLELPVLDGGLRHGNAKTFPSTLKKMAEQGKKKQKHNLPGPRLELLQQPSSPINSILCI